jgi:lipopolysaccharide cholinephosphotransferase
MDEKTLRDLQLAEIEILDEFVRICEKNNIQYFLDGGTLLGAIRHRGFIPWDDDIDVGMIRGDYDKFIRVCKTGLDSKYYLQSMETNKYCRYRAAARIRKNNTMFISGGAFYHAQDHRGIYIDIVPFDFIVNNRIILAFQLFLLEKLDNIIGIKRNNGQAKKCLYTTVKKIVYSMLPFNLIHFFQRCVMIPFFKTKYVLPWNLVYGFDNEIFPAAMLAPVTKVEFEGKYYSAPAQPDAFLRQMYGDYMQIPPVEKRRTHNPTAIIFDTTNKESP